jgi:acyl transferase domain-containing protein
MDIQAEPLAIVGVGMRLPGRIHSTEDLWSLLVTKGSTRCEVPKDRFNVEAFFSSSGRSGAVRTKCGHFLTEPSCLMHLDTHMFPVMRKELEVLDPQERLLLEVVYECMQNGGQRDWRGKDIGCFVGTFGEVRRNKERDFAQIRA